MRLRLAAAFAAFLMSLLAAGGLAAPAGAQYEATADTGGVRFGDVAFPNSGAAAAQPAFLRGLALLHNFQYDQAASAFREAQKIDAGFAMAYWGEAMTYNHGVWREQDRDAATAALARLGATSDQRLAKAPTAREKDFLRTLDVLYAPAGMKEQRDAAYSAAEEQLANRYPNDVEAQLFYALSLLSLFPRNDATYMRAAAIAERVMRDHPQHPGALHYVIHAYDDPAHAKLGLTAARAYSKVAVDAPHAQHMTSHIFIALGMWDDVASANEIAIHTNEAARGAKAVAEAYCGHAGLWLHYAYLQQGRLADARRIMEGCRAGSATSSNMARGYALMRLRTIVDVAQPGADVVAIPAEPAPSAVAHARDGFASALEALRRGDASSAEPLVAQLQADRVAFDASPAAASAPERSGEFAVKADEIRALVMLRRGKADDAVALLRATADREDAMPFEFGPPAIEKPARELLGETLLEIGRPADARRELERALQKTPGRSLTLLDLARAGRAAGDAAAARAAYAQLAANWHRADSNVAALQEARAGAADVAGTKP